MIKFIQGVSFDFAGPAVANVNGMDTTDMTGWVARSQIRSVNGALVADLDADFLQRYPAMIRISYSGDSSSWPVGPCRVDVQFTTPSGGIVATEAQLFDIVLGVTR